MLKSTLRSVCVIVAGLSPRMFAASSMVPPFTKISVARVWRKRWATARSTPLLRKTASMVLVTVLM